MSIGYLQRKAAWEILLKVSYGDFSDHALDKVLKNYQFNPLDIAFITELSFGYLIKFYLSMKYKEEKKLFFRERIHSLNIFLFLGFNLTLISILGFIWFNYSIEKVV